MIEFLFFGTLFGIFVGAVAAFIALKIFHFRIIRSVNPFETPHDLSDDSIAPEDAPPLNSTEHKNP